MTKALPLLCLLLAGVFAKTAPNKSQNKSKSKTHKIYQPAVRLVKNKTSGHMINLLAPTGSAVIDGEEEGLAGRTAVSPTISHESPTCIKDGATNMFYEDAGSTPCELELKGMMNMTGLEILHEMKDAEECPSNMVENTFKIMCDGEQIGEDIVTGARDSIHACLDIINWPARDCEKLVLRMESNSIEFSCHSKASPKLLPNWPSFMRPPDIPLVYKVDVDKDVEEIAIPGWVGMGGKDPHLRFADGGEADFRGVNNTVYSVLSGPGISFGLRTTDTDHLLPTMRYPKLVHGSFFTGAFWTLKHPTIGPDSNERARLYVYMPADGNGIYMREGLDDMQIAAMESAAKDTEGWIHAEGGQYEVGAVHIGFHREGRQLNVRAHGWEMNVTRNKIYNCYHCGPHDNRLDFTLRPLDGTPYAAKYGKSRMEVVAPHGLVGQSFDGDDLAVDGAKDDYHVVNPRWTIINTTAQLEGAIEGEAADYKLSAPFATAFKFSRFDAVKAPYRDVSKLTGRKHVVKRHGTTASSSEPLQPPDVDKLIAVANGDKPADKSVEGA